MQERGIKSLGNIADDYMKSMNELCGSLEKLTSTLETMTYMAENGLLQLKQTVEYKEESPDIFEKSMELIKSIMNILWKELIRAVFI